MNIINYQDLQGCLCNSGTGCLLRKKKFGINSSELAKATILGNAKTPHKPSTHVNFVMSPLVILSKLVTVSSIFVIPEMNTLTLIQPSRLIPLLEVEIML